MRHRIHQGENLQPLNIGEIYFHTVFSIPQEVMFCSVRWSHMYVHKVMFDEWTVIIQVYQALRTRG